MINEINPNKWTFLLKQNLLQLSQVYDLSPFLFTKTIHVESKVIPHSHPTLTLNTRYAEAPLKLLSTFLYQEFHWWLSLNPKKTKAAILDLKKFIPNAPVTLSMGKDSTYLRILAAQLEIMSLENYLGLDEAKKIILEKITVDKQDPWVYKLVQAEEIILKKILRAHSLVPPPLN